MAFLSKQIYSPVIVIVLLILLNLNLSFAQSSGSCASEVHEDHGPSHAHRHCHHEIGHQHHRHDDHQQQHDREMVWMKKLPEELAEEENLKLLGFGSDHHDHEHQDYSDLGLTGFGLWIHAIGCSLLVSLASFICLIILPLVLRQGKPSKAIVDSLAVFGRSTTTGAGEDKPNVDAANGSTFSVKSTVEKEPVQSPSTLVFGYLNLFSDGVHYFTDGMALGSAFLLYGSVGGWSRTLFLLAHELPQEIGGFGILVRSGFSVSTALFFNFLSALVALVGTALALLWGQDPGQSSLIEGFTAGGFIYIAVTGVLAEMNNGSSALKSTAILITSLILGMFVAHLPFVYPLLNEIVFLTVLYPC